MLKFWTNLVTWEICVWATTRLSETKSLAVDKKFYFINSKPKILEIINNSEWEVWSHIYYHDIYRIFILYAIGYYGKTLANPH